MMYDGKLEINELETINAVITGGGLIMERGMLTASISLEFADGNQSFGGYNLTNNNSASVFIRRVLEIVGVDAWHKIKGKSVRLKLEKWGYIHAIGNFIKDEWFFPEKEL